MTCRRRYSVDGIPAYCRPWYYGIAYWDWDGIGAICYPFGLHWLIRCYRFFIPTVGQRRLDAWRRRAT